MKEMLMILLLLPSLSYGATLDVKLESIKNGSDYAISLNDSIEAINLGIDYEYSEVENIIVKDKGSLNIHYDRDINKAWSLWLFNIAQYDKVYNTRENFLGAGPKYKILNSDHKLSFSTGILNDYDHIDESGVGRYSHRPKYAYKKLFDIVYFYQPRIDKQSDYIESYVINWKPTKLIKLYCSNEYRSLLGTIEDECGMKLSIEFGEKDEAN